MDADLRSHLDTADEHVTDLKRYLIMTDKQFKALLNDEMTQKWWEVLQIDQPEKFKVRNLIKQLLKKYLGLHSLTNRSQSSQKRRTSCQPVIVSGISSMRR